MRLSTQFMVILCAALFLCVIGTNQAMANNCPSCDIPNSGRICYATDDKVIYYCNGTTWVSTAGRLTATVPALWCGSGSGFSIGFPAGFRTIGQPVIGVKAISRYFYEVCIIKSDDTVACAPTNANTGYTTPPSVGVVKAISLAGRNLCAIKADNTLKCWDISTGVDLSGQAAVPVGIGTVKAVAAANWNFCAIKSNDTVQCWGDNSNGMATVPGGLGTVKGIYGRNDAGTFCAIKTNDDVVCWGDDNPAWGYSPLLPIPVGLKAKRVDFGSSHACVIKLDDTVQCWGHNSGGQTDVPVGLTNVKELIMSQGATIAIKTDNSIVTWPSSLQAWAQAAYGHIFPYTLIAYEGTNGEICYVK